MTLRHYLRPLVAPSSVALFGASERPGSLGRIVYENMLAGGFRGETFAVSVADDWKRRGVARVLMERLIAYAKQRGLLRLEGSVLKNNANMLKFTEALGFKVTKRSVGARASESHAGTRVTHAPSFH